MRYPSLVTPFEGGTRSWREYPRPQLRRDSYLSLCGPWDLSLAGDGGEEPLGTVEVPFPPESRLSGIGRTPGPGQRLIYRRSFPLEAGWLEGHVLLHFGAADQLARVLVNGHEVLYHEGGYLPFEADIAPYAHPGENQLTVEIRDDLDEELPYGKQRRARGGMWYTPISGLWQSVWLEAVPRNYIRSLRIDPSLTHLNLHVEGGSGSSRLLLTLPEGTVEHTFTGNDLSLPIDSPILWTPERPHLYPFTLISGEDRVESYFALRTVSAGQLGEHSYILLNGEPVFCHGLLDQGYFSDGIYLPASPEGYERDILTAKRLGFNTLRKHIKIEPELFYYYCDKYGMLVFQDMVNSGRYSFLLDTALPTAGLRRGIRHRASPRRRRHFEQTMEGTLQLLYNHPCVVYYTVFNEGWGQYDADRLYQLGRQLDPTRLWDATSGWFTGRDSDVTSEHIYFRPIRLRARPDRPLVLSEFGGYGWQVPGHCFDPGKAYGYRNFTSAADLMAALSALYTGEVVPAIGQGLCAAILTQLSDVEDEINGLITYDRQQLKVDEPAMAAIADALFRAFSRQVAADRAAAEAR